MARKTETMRKTGASPPAEEASRREIETSELAERIERLEQRLEESLLGDDGLAETDKGIDRNPSGDALRRAVRRSNVKRGSRKA